MNNPCLSDCIKKDGHAPGCPNAEAPTAPKCCRGAEYLTARNEMACLDCGKILFKIKMPKPAPAPVDHSEQDLNMVPPERPRSLFDLEVERLKALEAQHNRLCLADLGGDGVWPCGCHHLIVDSHGTRKLLTAADGEVHQECDDHSALRAELAQAREAGEERARQLTARAVQVHLELEHKHAQALEELREYIRRRDKSGRWGEERAALRAAVDSLTLDAERSAKTETALRAEVLKRDEEAGYQEVLEADLRAELAQAKAVRR